MKSSKLKMYNSSPLPFQGQKRRFVNDFKKALKHFDKATIFVDLFGGSGLLSHITKRERPDAQVIYNDFDDYHIRIENVTNTNKLLSDIRSIVLSAGIQEDKKIPAEIKKVILSRVLKDEKEGYVDYITLSASLLFSMKYVTSYEGLEKETMYNTIRKTAYDCSNYTDGLEIVKLDYRILFDKYKLQREVVFIVDPPYLSTDTGTYRNYWKLKDYLDVINVLKETSYIYFTSDKSQIVELLDWVKHNKEILSVFDGSKKEETLNYVNYNSSYRDLMFYKLAG